MIFVIAEVRSRSVRRLQAGEAENDKAAWKVYISIRRSVGLLSLLPFWILRSSTPKKCCKHIIHMLMPRTTATNAYRCLFPPHFVVVRPSLFSLLSSNTPASLSFPLSTLLCILLHLLPIYNPLLLFGGTTLRDLFVPDRHDLLHQITSLFLLPTHYDGSFLHICRPRLLLQLDDLRLYGSSAARARGTRKGLKCRVSRSIGLYRLFFC